MLNRFIPKLRREMMEAIITLAFVTLLAGALPASATAEQPAKPSAKGKTPLNLSADPPRLKIQQCIPEMLRVGIANPSAQARYAEVFIDAEPPVESSRQAIASYLPSGYRLVVPLRVSAGRGAAPGEYEIVFETGGRDRLTVPVELVNPSGGQCIPREQMTVTATSSQRPAYVPANAIDKDRTTFWHSQYDPRLPLPQGITLGLGDTYDATRLVYQPRTDGNACGYITEYNVYASSDGEQYTKVATGTWAGNSSQKVISFQAPAATHIRLEATESTCSVVSVAEVILFGQSVE